VPLIAPRFTVWDKVMVLVTLAGLVGYAADAVRLMRGSAKALEKAQAEAQEASRAKSAFLSMMSHELRTPMNGVLGMAHALGSTKLDARQADYLETIIQSGDGLMAILNDILDLSKIEAGKLELESAPFDVRQLGRPDPTGLDRDRPRQGAGAGWRSRPTAGLAGGRRPARSPDPAEPGLQRPEVHRTGRVASTPLAPRRWGSCSRCRTPASGLTDEQLAICSRPSPRATARRRAASAARAWGWPSAASWPR
jgi:hypothetical protein